MLQLWQMYKCKIFIIRFPIDDRRWNINCQKNEINLNSNVINISIIYVIDFDSPINIINKNKLIKLYRFSNK